MDKEEFRKVYEEVTADTEQNRAIRAKMHAWFMEQPGFRELVEQYAPKESCADCGKENPAEIHTCSPQLGKAGSFSND